MGKIGFKLDTDPEAYYNIRTKSGGGDAAEYNWSMDKFRNKLNSFPWFSENADPTWPGNVVKSVSAGLKDFGQYRQLCFPAPRKSASHRSEYEHSRWNDELSFISYSGFCWASTTLESKDDKFTNRLDNIYVPPGRMMVSESIEFYHGYGIVVPEVVFLRAPNDNQKNLILSSKTWEDFTVYQNTTGLVMPEFARFLRMWLKTKSTIGNATNLDFTQRIDLGEENWGNPIFGWCMWMCTKRPECAAMLAGSKKCFLQTLLEPVASEFPGSQAVEATPLEAGGFSQPKSGAESDQPPRHYFKRVNDLTLGAAH